MTQDLTNITKQRTRQQLITLMNGLMLNEFNDPQTVELMANPDGLLYVEKLGEPMKLIGQVSPDTVSSIIYNVAGFHNQVCDQQHPICEAEFPLDDSRFEGLLPPVVRGASFSLRKKASLIFTLDDYVKSGTMTPEQKKVILTAVASHLNILVVGGTGSGKTTLINAIIEAMVHSSEQERIVIIEDTGEIQCSAANHVQMRSNKFTSMTDLLRATLRYRPDRILVGEVRGGEALDLLDAWNTGHPGGCATLHANDAYAGLNRLKSLITRNPQHPNDIEALIGEAVHIVICIARFQHGRRIKQILKVNGWSYEKGYQTELIA